MQLHEFEAEFEYYRYQNENPEAVTIPIGLGNITERCTLNCKHCFAEVPYIENPKDTPFELFKESIDHYSAYFDKIQNMHLSGGEPLMHPKIYDMIEYTAQQENIQRVRVFSNGTLLINEEKLKKIDKTKVSFYFSHYGDYSIKLEENSKLLDKLEFDYIVVDHDHWFERNTKISFCPQNDNEKELVKKYRNCIKSDCYYLDENFFTRCGINLLAMENAAVPKEFIDVVHINPQERTTEEIKNDLRKYLKKDYLQLCKYCVGRTAENSLKVPVAEQLPRNWRENEVTKTD